MADRTKSKRYKLYYRYLGFIEGISYSLLLLNLSVYILGNIKRFD